MFEQKFLSGILCTALIDFRVQAVDDHDDIVFRFSDIFHNVPPQLLNEEEAAKGYAWVLHAEPVWVKNQREKFFQQFSDLDPEENKRKFLAFLLQTVLADFKTHGETTGNKPLYWLSHLLQDIPLSLLSPDSAKSEYKRLVEKFKEHKVEKWLENRKQEYYDQYNEFIP
jgi:hypothetical protein